MTSQNATPCTERIRQEIIEREQAAFEAWRRKDKAFYDEYWAEDMTGFMPDSVALVHKADMMPAFAELVEKWQLGPIEMIDPDVRLYGDVAVLTYREQVTGSYQGAASSYYGKVTMIYVRQNDEWRGVHYHESK